MVRMRRLSSALVLCSIGASAASPELFNALRWRNIGPFRGGRVDAVAGVAGDPTTFYFGSVGGGVWKTTNAGITWNPIFDGQPVASIGAIAIAPSNANVIYVGTGETDIRSQIGFGDGIYKSSDAGKTWSHIGLRETRQIAKILVDPRDPDVVYVAALGHVYGPNPERGVFRSRDGGRNWQKILFTTTGTGAVDLAWDPSNTKVIFATMWNAHRPPWSQYEPIEGPGSGLWKTLDGGDHWTQIVGHGLPSSMWRRSGVAVTPGGSRVYLLLDAQSDAGLYHSDDSGGSWTKVGAEERLDKSGVVLRHSHGRSEESRHCVRAERGAVPLHEWRRLVHRPEGRAGRRRLPEALDRPGGAAPYDRRVRPGHERQCRRRRELEFLVQPADGADVPRHHRLRFPYNVYGAQQDSGALGLPSRTDHGTIAARDWFSVGRRRRRLHRGGPQGQQHPVCRGYHRQPLAIRPADWDSRKIFRRRRSARVAGWQASHCRNIASRGRRR